MRHVLVLMIATAVGCSGNTSPSVLLSVSAPTKVEQYDLYVRDDASHTIVIHTGWADATKGGTKDISTSPFKIGLTLGKSGSYTVVLVGAIGPTLGVLPEVELGARQFFWARTIAVNGQVPVAAALVEVPLGDDADRDLFPDAMTWPTHEAAASAIDPTLYDCDDKSIEKGIPPARVNPFATVNCLDNVDEDCSGMIVPCADSDGDGDPDVSDCKPMDPTIHHPITDPTNPHYDPFPQSANCCGYSLGRAGSDAHKSFAGDPTCHVGRCDTGIDYDCSGTPAVCKLDQDCDGFGAKSPEDQSCMAPSPDKHDPTDCDDCNGAVNPAAPEICDGIDNNCNGLTDETCVTCDLDGDGYQRMDAKDGCPDPKTDQHPGLLDCNDEDAGVFPGSTAKAGHMEGGSTLGALRGLCLNKNPDGSAQDADCDGKVLGCPVSAMVNGVLTPCDADGDGFVDVNLAAECDPMGVLAHDCDDTDPHTWPGAPDKCGDTVKQNCFQDRPCTTDADGDGYQGMDDCNDNDATIHPWATEKCDGVDNDCDGLIDETNPDANGIAMVMASQVLHCTASAVGACAAPPGDCVCSSSSVAGSHFDQTKRVACPGEGAPIDTGAMASLPAPRCYFARQPSPDICNGIDDDCDPTTPDGASDCPGPTPSPLCCSGTCRDPAGDVHNCGGCAIVCTTPNATPQCVNAACAVLQCNPGFGDCNGKGSDGCEVTVSTDANNCGGCGKACAAVPNGTPGCVGGACIVGSCTAPFLDCNGLPGDGCELNTSSDVQNCGACGNRCPKVNGSTTCVNGVCVGGMCTPPHFHCTMNPNDVCETNLSSDLANCGTCGTVCGAVANGQPGCINAKCGIVSCAMPFADCNNTVGDGCETNLSTSVASCGTCNKACATPAHGVAGCVAGACTIASCAMPFADCNNNVGDGCETDLSSSLANCGICGSGCAPANATGNCAAGVCSVKSCNAGFADCDGMVGNGCETNVNGDPANCGKCGMVCPAIANGSSTCSAGKCGVAMCNAGFADCNNNLADGCETNTATSVANCGGCNKACATPNHGVAGCVGGACNIASCSQGFGDCNKLASDGCETDLTSTASNCGTCGAVCNLTNAVADCMNSACGVQACTASFADCDKIPSNGCEVNTASDPANCGGCGTVCKLANAVAGCANKTCTVASCTASFLDCDKNPGNGCEVNGATDANNCGGCGKQCKLANASSSCANQTCGVTSCNQGYLDCNKMPGDGCEVNETNDANNCGGCGTSCAIADVGHLCVSSACGCYHGYDCNGSVADGCENAKCTCGNGTVCDGNKANCSGGKCLLLNGQSCNNNNQCLSGNCDNGNHCK